MLKFALEMLWTERKKTYGLIISIVTTLGICLLFLHFIVNPYLARKVTYDDMLDFSESFCIMLMGLFILMVCVSLICYSCNYYMKLHAREIGMLKMAGFNQGKVVLYQLIQMIMLMVVSVIITCCLSLVTTPIFLTIVYRYCHIHQSVFYFNFKLFKMLGILVVCILVVLIAMQINYINNNSLSSLIKDKYITTPIITNALMPNSLMISRPLSNCSTFSSLVRPEPMISKPPVLRYSSIISEVSSI